LAPGAASLLQGFGGDEAPALLHLGGEVEGAIMTFKDCEGGELLIQVVVLFSIAE